VTRAKNVRCNPSAPGVLVNDAGGESNTHRWGPQRPVPTPERKAWGHGPIDEALRVVAR